MVERERGVRAALRDRGADSDLTVVQCGNESFDDTQSALAVHLADAGLPDAVIGGNDRMALAAMQLLKRKGIAIPDSVMVTGFNAFESRSYSDPLLTSVFSPAYEMGERGGHELIRRLEEGRFASTVIRLPVRFAPGQTTHCTQSDIAEPILALPIEPDAKPRARKARRLS
jgi:LacI family transcriptional regulator